MPSMAFPDELHWCVRFQWRTVTECPYWGMHEICHSDFADFATGCQEKR